MSEVLLNQEGFLEYIKKYTHTLKHIHEAYSADYMLEKIRLSQNHFRYTPEELKKKSQELAIRDNSDELAIDYEKLNFNYVYLIEYKKNQHLVFLMYYKTNYYAVEFRTSLSGKYVCNILSSQSLGSMYETYKENEAFMNPAILDKLKIKEAKLYFDTLLEKEKLEVSLNHEVETTLSKLKI